MHPNDIPNHLRPLLEKLNGADLSEYRTNMGISKERLNLLHDVLSGTQDVRNLDSRVDIQLFALKTVFKAEYLAAKVKPLEGETKHLITYDPPKNGQNIIKHGLSFTELATYSPGFGILMVPCPSKDDCERLVIFNRLEVHEAYEFDLPTKVMRERSDLCTLTIALTEGEGFRVISSRPFHRDNWDKIMAAELKGIYADEPKEKKSFIEKCQKKVEGELFGPMWNPGYEPPARVIRPGS